MLVWVNTEFVKRHGDPWLVAERAKAKAAASDRRLGTLRRVQEESDDDEEDEDDEPESEDDMSVIGASTPYVNVTLERGRDVEMVA